MAEASSLAHKISKTFLECTICFDPFQDPRALPCHHGFCKKCLKQLVQSSEDKCTLVCPICRESIQLSKEGVNDLPVHFLVSSLQDTVNMEKRVPIPSTDTRCSNCNLPDKKATVRCMTCKEYLCETCHASHRTWKSMKDHKVIHMDDILSGKVSLTAEDDDQCQEHGQPYRYYCEDEEKAVCQDCVILKECPTEHGRVTLEKAIKLKSAELDGLSKKCNDTLEKYKDAVKKTEDVKSELKIHSQLAKQSLSKAKKVCIDQLEQIVKNHEAEIDRIRMERLQELDKTKTRLQCTVKQIQKAKEDTTRVTESGSKYEVITTHATLSSKLQELSQSLPTAADRSLGYVKFEAAIPTVPSIGQLLVGKDAEPHWKPTNTIDTGEFDKLYGIAINPDNNIAITSDGKGVKVFTRSGEVKYTFKDSPSQVMSIAMSPDNKYVLDGDYGEILMFDSQGIKLSTIPITDIDDKESNANSVAIDSKGRLIVGQVNNTISIHNPDGSLISKFATQSRPLRLAITSNDEIVCSFYDATLDHSTSVQLMDYSGGNIRIIQPPPNVEVWRPSYIYCRQGEIFVVKSSACDPDACVYRYTSLGTYLGCVTTDVINPSGIALSKDGMELFVVDHGEDVVKIFQRQ